MTKDQRQSVFRSAQVDAETARQIPQTPQTMSPSYHLAFRDPDFLMRHELRPVRLQLELLKPELALADHGIESTVVLFGGARIRPEGQTDGLAPGLAALSGFYEEALKLGRLIGEACVASGGREHVVITGGGPGIMEAGNRGAAEAGAPTIGLNIVLPREQAPNPYVTPDLCFNFHYFALRKMHFLMRARAIVAFPGGFGTLDELFEALTLMQTRRMERVPVVLFGEAFWNRIIDWQALVEAGTISEQDLSLFRHVETAEEAWAIIRPDGARDAG